MEQRRSHQAEVEVHSEDEREVLCERCKKLASASEEEYLLDDRSCIRKVGEIAMSQSVVDTAQIRRDLRDLKYKKAIRKQDLKARRQFYDVVAISQQEGVSMKEAARIYLERMPKK